MFCRLMRVIPVNRPELKEECLLNGFCKIQIGICRECCIFHSHCVKSVRMRSYSGPHFPAFGLNTHQNNSEYGRFLRTKFVVYDPFIILETSGRIDISLKF